MTRGIRLLGSLVAAGLIVFAFQRICPERLEIFLFWSLPFFHILFRPLASGPNPLAAFCSLVTDVVLLAGLLFFVLSGNGKENDRG